MNFDNTEIYFDKIGIDFFSSWTVNLQSVDSAVKAKHIFPKNKNNYADNMLVPTI